MTVLRELGLKRSTMQGPFDFHPVKKYLQHVLLHCNINSGIRRNAPFLNEKIQRED
jgi:hypothetical protein